MATAPPLVLAPELTDPLGAEGKDLKVPQLETSNHLNTAGGKTSTWLSPAIQKADVEANSIPFDPASLQAKYHAERDKRLAANPDGLDQYISIDKEDPLFRSYLDDPYIREPIRRDPIQQETEVLIIGGGFGGQLVAARLIEQGVTDISIVEKGGDFGESYVYMPLLHETGYVPTEKYAKCDELLRHAQMLGRHMGLYERTLFQTEVKRLVWEEATDRWLVHTDRNDSIKARFVVSASGPLHRPKIPGLRGLRTFRGHSFHTTRWDYSYTGGNNYGDLKKLADKRVGIIGTGATSVQVVPRLGEWARELFVFQRTPSSVDIRDNRPTDPEWVKSLGEGWQKERMDNFNIVVNGGYQPVDLVADGWTDIFRKLTFQEADLKNASVDMVKLAKRRQMYDFEKMEQIRTRVDSIVKDPVTAKKLKPYYNQFCKRPCFHDEYLQTFNRPNVTLIDTDGKGVQAITEKGLIANGKEYELDCIIWATGFDLVGEWSHRNGYDIIGEKGQALSDKWRDGMSTLHGWITHGFPNCCFISVAQAAFTPNVIHVTDEQARHFAYVISEAKKRDVKTFQPTQEAENSWVDTIVELSKLKDEFNRECTPGYYNNEGKPSMAAARNANYGAGPLKFFELMAQWRDKGDLAGLMLR
ncbi:hypothetical protein LTR10_013344 [Elasticomyces elasticus]|nr:hypothetical protein LTR10_013344 [Elasticomyces elasticus]KAK5034871.1 hypothetical protein LTR13_006053 [Exophiala sideris]KAK5181116.1 hypothetical protein LTR44_006447 [Eurotiomycetes sp. CCFEE 6388]